MCIIKISAMDVQYLGMLSLMMMVMIVDDVVIKLSGTVELADLCR